MPDASVALAPGRVNLIGEHTDYNDGFVLPMAISRYTRVAFRWLAGRTLRVQALDQNDRAEIPLDSLTPGAHDGWAAYIAGVAWALQQAGYPVEGADLTISSDVPMGAGLSSSAALELATARALCALSDLPWDAVRMATLARRAENEFVGVQCGIMDQFASAVARAGCALLLDCRSLESQQVNIPTAAAIIVLDTGARRGLNASAYNQRVAECRRAAAALQVSSLRDATLDSLEAARAAMDRIAYRRARHVIAETQRPLELAAAFAGNDLDRAGRLMHASHESLRDLYEVSSVELDAVVDAAMAHPACYGARLTGAGFGGCAVALVRREAAGDFMAAISASYASRFSLPYAFFQCEPAQGAHLLDATQAPGAPARPS